VAAAATAAPFFCLNAAPARGPLELTPDLLVVNRWEYEQIGAYAGLVALTSGAEGAVLLEGGREVASARPPRVRASTAPQPGMPSALRWSSACWRDASAARLSSARAQRDRWRHRAPGLSRRCPPPPSSRRSWGAALADQPSPGGVVPAGGEPADRQAGVRSGSWP
jgi:hypothetical protein